MVPAQENGVCWGIGEEGGESSESAGEFGQESGEGGHRSMFCKSIEHYLFHVLSKSKSSVDPLLALSLVPARRAIRH